MADKELQPRFTAAEDELLIELVSELPILYDAKLKEYKNTVLREAKWKKIGEKTNKTGNQCKTRWRSIRDHYKKLKKAGKLPTGSEAQKKNRKTYFERLHFLDTVETERESITNVEDIDMSENEDMRESEGDNHSEPNSDREGDVSSQYLHPASEQREESAIIIPSTSTSNVFPSQFSISAAATRKKIQGSERHIINRSKPAVLSPKPNSPVTAKKRKTNKGNDKIVTFLERQNKERTIHLDTLQRCLQQEKVEDEIDLFFKTMAASVKKFPAHSKTSVKMKISQIVFQEEIRLSSLPTSMTNFKYSYPEYQITSSEATLSRPPSSAMSTFSGNSMSETIPMPTPSPNEPQLNSDLTLNPYWQSFNTQTD